MAALFKPVTIFFWFVSQAVFVGGLGVVFFAAPFLLLLLGMIVGLRRAQAGSWRPLIPVIVGLPAIWIFVGLWGGAFWRDWIHHPPPSPHWVGYPIMVALGCPC
jgi:hypothetical protein